MPRSALAVVGDRAARTSSTSPTTSPRSTRPGSGRSWSPSPATPVCARFDACGRPEPWPRPRRGRDRRHRPGRRSLDRGRVRPPASTPIRDAIAAGDVYQVNLHPAPVARRCRPERPTSPRWAPRWPTGNPAPYQRRRAPAVGRACTWRRRRPSCSSAARADGSRSAPDQGHGRDRRRRSCAKDRAENVMIVDLVRNDLGRVCEYGSVEVPALLAVEPHPGLVHLVSAPSGPAARRRRLGRAASTPRSRPGSVTGAPKLARPRPTSPSSSPCARGVYCGAVGWVDADRRRRASSTSPSARSGSSDGQLHFGTGGGHHLGLDPGRRVGRDRAEGPPPAGRRVGVHGCGARRDAWSGSTARSSTRARRRISPFDHGLTVGDGVFETLRVYGGAPFAVAPPPRAAGALGGRASASPVARRRRARARPSARCVAANGLTDGRLRITVTGGAGAARLGPRRRRGRR